MNNPFENLSQNQINKLFNLLGVHIYRFGKNAEILPTIRNEDIIGIIMEGHAQIINIEYNGNETVEEDLVKNSIFGTNISLTNTENYQIIAKTDTQVLVIDYDRLSDLDNLKHTYFNIFIMNIFNIINSKFKETNERIRVLKKKQIREKLLEYFDIERKKNRLTYFDLPFTFRDLADYLAINRSAMFRELKNMKEENLIKIKGRRVTLLYK